MKNTLPICCPYHFHAICPIPCEKTLLPRHTLLFDAALQPFKRQAKNFFQDQRNPKKRVLLEKALTLLYTTSPLTVLAAFGVALFGAPLRVKPV